MKYDSSLGFVYNCLEILEQLSNLVRNYLIVRKT